MTWTVQRASVVAASALALVAPCSLAAQNKFPTGPAVERALRDTTLVTQIPGRWNANGASLDSRVARAERTTMVGALGRIAELLHTALGTLPGVEADVTQDVSFEETPGGHVTGGTVKVLLWPYSVRDGKLAFYNNASESLFEVNKTVCTGDDAFGAKIGYILGPRLTGHFHGFPMLDSAIVITHRSQPPCLPVSRSEVIAALRRQITDGARTTDSAWDAQVAATERSLPQLEKTNPTLAAATREQLTQLATARHTADSTRASFLQMFDAGMARMSPAERASAAYTNGECSDDTDPTTCFVGPDAPNARAIVRENPAFFDTSRPGDVQLVTLSIKSLYDSSANEGYPDRVMAAALDRFDWNALSAMVH